MSASVLVVSAAIPTHLEIRPPEWRHGAGVDATEAVAAWQRLAAGVIVNWAEASRTWEQHTTSRTGYLDEERLIQPIVFPRFAQELLGFTVGQTLAPEQTDRAGVPDFTPADAVTHPFVFETKSTSYGTTLPRDQVRRYLTEGQPRIRRVVLTNLVVLETWELDQAGQPALVSTVNLRGLLGADAAQLSTTGDARRLAEFIDAYSYRELSQTEKLDRIRRAHPWNPVFEIPFIAWVASAERRQVRAPSPRWSPASPEADYD